MAGKKLSKSMEKKVLELVAMGVEHKDIAAQLGIGDRTVREVLSRHTVALKLELPALSDKRISSAETARRISHARDCALVLLEGAVERTKCDLEMGKNPVAAATTMGIAIDKIVALDGLVQLMRATSAKPPRTEQKKQDSYVRLLWALSAGGSIPAAKLLAKAWGIEENAGRANLRFEIGRKDGDVADDTTGNS